MYLYCTCILILAILGPHSTTQIDRQSTELLFQWDDESSMPEGNKPRRHILGPPLWSKPALGLLGGTIKLFLLIACNVHTEKCNLPNQNSYLSQLHQ